MNYSITYFEEKSQSIKEQNFDDFYKAMEWGKENLDNFKCEMINEVEEIDLFETPENLPDEMKVLLKDFEKKDNSYTNCKKLLKKCLKLGYTFDYGLDAIPYELKKIE